MGVAILGILKWILGLRCTFPILLKFLVIHIQCLGPSLNHQVPCWLPSSIFSLLRGSPRQSMREMGVGALWTMRGVLHNTLSSGPKPWFFLHLRLHSPLARLLRTAPTSRPARWSVADGWLSLTHLSHTHRQVHHLLHR